MLESALLHINWQVVQVVLLSLVMVSFASAFTSMSTLIITSSGTVTTQEQFAFTPAQQSWVQNLVVGMSGHNPPSLTSAASSMAVSLSTCNNTIATLHGQLNVHECVVTYMYT